PRRGAHVGGPARRQRDPARVIAVFLGVALNQEAGGMPTELPRRRGRHRAGIDRKEIAPGRQHFRTAAAWRAARPGRHEATVEPGEDARNFLLSTRGYG